MRKRIKKLFPLGLDIPGQVAIIVGLLMVVFVFGYLQFFANYKSDVLVACYKPCEDVYLLKDNYQMPKFLPMLRNCFNMVWYIIALLGIVIYNYRYHYGVYKSIYLMRRIENVWEIHRRCWGIVIIGILGAVICMIALWAMCYGHYCIYELPERYEYRYLF